MIKMDQSDDEQESYKEKKQNEDPNDDNFNVHERNQAK